MFMMLTSSSEGLHGLQFIIIASTDVLFVSNKNKSKSHFSGAHMPFGEMGFIIWENAQTIPTYDNHYERKQVAPCR